MTYLWLSCLIAIVAMVIRTVTWPSFQHLCGAVGLKEAKPEALRLLYGRFGYKPLAAIAHTVPCPKEAFIFGVLPHHDRLLTVSDLLDKWPIIENLQATLTTLREPFTEIVHWPEVPAHDEFNRYEGYWDTVAAKPAHDEPVLRDPDGETRNAIQRDISALRNADFSVLRKRFRCAV